MLYHISTFSLNDEWLFEGIQPLKINPWEMAWSAKCKQGSQRYTATYHIAPKLVRWVSDERKRVGNAVCNAVPLKGS